MQFHDEKSVTAEVLVSLNRGKVDSFAFSVSLCSGPDSVIHVYQVNPLFIGASGEKAKHSFSFILGR